MTIELAPSILSANFARLGEDAKAGARRRGTVIHCDVWTDISYRISRLDHWL